jgi:hypothetical protein
MTNTPQAGSEYRDLSKTAPLLIVHVGIYNGCRDGGRTASQEIKANGEVTGHRLRVWIWDRRLGNTDDAVRVS